MTQSALPIAPHTLILGVGSPLMGDDAIGVVAVGRLRARGDLPPGVDVVDGGTDGLGLIPLLEPYRRVIVVDAVRMDTPAGTIRRFTWQDIRARTHDRALSLHQGGLSDALALAETLDMLPPEVVIIGVEPAQTDWDDPLSAPVAEALPTLLDALLAEARRDF